jgi:small-conductance mechanosensitive channel
MLNDLFTRFPLLVEISVPLAIFLVVLISLLIVRRIISGRLSYWAKKTSTQLDDIILQTVRGPSLIICLMLSVYFALQFSRLPDNIMNVMSRSILVLGIISVVLALANLLSGMIKFYTSKIDSGMAVTSLTQNAARIFVFLIGALIILNSLGISITPILATLGVGGLAVALALQDTLTNLFAGFNITMAKQIKVGDYVRLDTGEEGYIVDINWRSTKIKMLSNNLVLVPNDKINKAIVTNYFLPDKETAVLVDVGVHYKSDLEKVEKVTCEVAKSVMQDVSGGIAYFEPFIRYNSFGDSCVKFSVILRAREFVDQYMIKHEFIKRLHKRYAQEGINIPYPIVAVNYGQEKSS